MNRNRLIYTLVGAVVIVILLYSFLESGGQENYVQEILNKREETDLFMRNSIESPFLNNLEDYHGLSYFEPDQGYKINADFVKISDGEIRRLPTSDGKQELYQEYGYADFELDGRDHRLLILMMVEGKSNHIFIPFADSTSGEETYGAGRYLEVPSIRSGKVLLDFNLAYNPYCAYSSNYSCPLPPAENYLATSIMAGEKSYDK